MIETLIERYMGNYMAAHGVPPSIREIMAACSISTTSLVKIYLDKMVASGVLVKNGDNTSRAYVPKKALRAIQEAYALV